MSAVQGRWSVRSLALLATICYLGAAFTKLWGMVLTSTFYYQGLHLNVFANEVTGDLHELNILNHYIGMLTIGDNMPEFHYIRWVLILLALTSIAVALWPRRRVAGLLTGLEAAVLVLLGADFYWRLYEYGHVFDLSAPMKVQPFTPQIWGNYQLANFHVVTAPGLGSFLLVMAFFLMLLVLVSLPKES
ncbi:hypothetical protein [Alicyclobacillus sp.]|uniref:hypothetical protein n=1 Tax=Alicyclobacillus sp. TaxID=61169 RepID=UPI0025C3091E|nr:hypothetical protein [Alicyclobacillus sp.]MCL6517038.1 hypothetical protein [Alicyclobacillus sp.]